jgi:1-deoxyxylulose-5-phosphate synthase
MKYGQIAGVEKPVSRVGQGTMMLRSSEQESMSALLDAVLETGVTFFDAGAIYGGGDCDRAFGSWVRDRGVRDRVVLMDKGCHHNADRRRVTPFDLSADLHDCLARLGFDHIDVFACHRDDESVPVGPMVERFNQHIREGKISAYGFSNWSHARIAEATEFAKDNGLVPPAVSSPHFSLAECREDPWGGGAVSITGEDGREAREWYRNTQMPIASWSALSGGFFSGRFQRDNLESFTDDADQRCVRCYCCEENFRRLDRAAELAQEKGATVAQIALAWQICGALYCFPLMAAWTTQQASENGAAGDIELSQTEVDWLDLLRDER